MATYTDPTKKTIEDLYCMVYISRITTSGLISPRTLEDIVDISTKNNAINGITGVLCYGNGYFFQYVEGSELALTQLKNQLLKDSRHQKMKILYFEKIPERQFSNWKLQSLIVDRGLESDPEVNQLIPFRPDRWQDDEEWRSFLVSLKAYYITHKDETKPTEQYNALGLTVSKLIGEHQVFFLIQTLLGGLMVAGILAIIIELR